MSDWNPKFVNYCRIKGLELSLDVPISNYLEWLKAKKQQFLNSFDNYSEEKFLAWLEEQPKENELWNSHTIV